VISIRDDSSREIVSRFVLFPYPSIDSLISALELTTVTVITSESTRMSEVSDATARRLYVPGDSTVVSHPAEKL